MGTGSGAIAVTLALERSGLRVIGVDLSESALSFAQRNVARHGCEVSLVQGDLLEPFHPGSLEMIVANLPYLDPAQSSRWPTELHWEPWLSQDGGPGGLAKLTHLIAQAASRIRETGWMVLEVGDGQSHAVTEMARAQGFRVERVVEDLTGRKRVLLLQRETAWKG